MGVLTAIRAERLYDGIVDRPLRSRTVVIENGVVDGIVSGDPALPETAVRLDAPLLVPGFIDMQINGACDVLFNDAPSPESLALIAAGARQGGAACILPTFITARGDAYLAAIDGVMSAREAGEPGILGIHLEGPFLSPARPGVHDPAAIRPMTPADLEHLKIPRPGVRLITLAPEEQPSGAIADLTSAGWTVFAGHSEARFDTMRLATDQGLRGVTHLFNAMSQIGPREPGVVGSALDDERLFAGLIADGHHVHPANLELAASRLGAARLCLVTDAMPTLGGRSSVFPLLGKAIRLKNGRLVDGDGRLAGAHLSMTEAVRNLVRLTGTSLADALRMASSAPANALGLGDIYGRIARGYHATLTLLDAQFCCRGVFVDDRWLPNPPSPDGSV